MSATELAVDEPDGADGIVLLRLDQLQIGPSIRRGGIDRQQVHRLVEDAGAWPPILVKKGDRLVIDGLHRIEAAKTLGWSTIACSYFEGSADQAYLEAIQRNVRHGLPLTLRDRKAAARQVLCLRAGWSDRRIAELVALAPGTVGRIRASLRPSGQYGQSDGGRPGGVRRVGRDGRARPRDLAALHREIVSAIETSPTESLRAIASRVGSSPETVRRVRAEIVPHPNLDGRARAGLALLEHPAAQGDQYEECTDAPADVGRTFQSGWLDDVALRSAPSGDRFVTWFSRTTVNEEWSPYLPAVPLSRVYEIADEARRRARYWSEFAAALEDRARPKSQLVPR